MGAWRKVFVKALPITIIKFSDKPSWSETFCRFYPFIAESFVNLRHPTMARKFNMYDKYTLLYYET